MNLEQKINELEKRIEVLEKEATAATVAKQITFKPITELELKKIVNALSINQSRYLTR